MFDLSLSWDRPAATGPDPTSHVLRARITAKPGAQSLAASVAIAFDASGSMTGDKMDHAKQACLSAAKQLRPQDRISIAGYSDTVKSLCQQVGGEKAACVCEDALKKLPPAGVTRLDLALEWIDGVLGQADGSARIAVIITDGYPTDARGGILKNMAPLVEKAAGIAAKGITICTVGLGDARYFNAGFLTKLADKGRGAFVFAEKPEELSGLLEERFSATQSIAAGDAALKINLLRNGVTITGCCKISPVFNALDAPAPGQDSMAIGALDAEAAVDVLISLEVPPLGFGENPGQQEIVEVELVAAPGMASVKARASILFTSSYTEAQKVDKEVDRQRILWDVNLYTAELHDTSDLQRTGELLTDIQFNAAKAGQDDVAQNAKDQLAKLNETGELDRNAGARLTGELRSLGSGS